MINIQSIKDIYPAIKELIKIFEKDDNCKNIVLVLKHRMFEVSWTSSSELYEELSRLFKGFLVTNRKNLDRKSINQIKRIIYIINKEEA